MIGWLTGRVWQSACAGLAIALAVTLLSLAVSRGQVAKLERDAARLALEHTTALGVANAKAADKERRWVSLSKEVADRAHTTNETQRAANRAATATLDRAVAEARRRAGALRNSASGAVAGDGLRIPGAGGDRAQGSPTPGAACDCESAIEAARVSTELFSWSATRLSIVADFADRAWLAADTCQRTYEVTEP